MAEEEPPPLEEQIDSGASDGAGCGSDSDSDDDDDEPPSLEQVVDGGGDAGPAAAGAAAARGGGGAPAGAGAGAGGKKAAEEDEGPSMRDLMQQEAEAEAKKRRAREEKEKRRMAKSFGKGFKLKGFFNRTKKKKKKPAAAATDGAGGGSTGGPKNPELPYVTKNTSAEADDINGLRLPEVQEALKKASTQLEEDKTWVTDDLVQQVKQNEKLQKAMNNPRFALLVQAMQNNPAAVAERAKTDPELQEFLKEFTGLMGSHFEKLGAKEDPERAAREAAERAAAEKAAAEKAAVEKAAAEAAADPKVQEVLQNADLRAVLMDPKMRTILQECNDPRAVQRYMRDPVVGPKLRLMVKHGLLQFQ